MRHPRINSSNLSKTRTSRSWRTSKPASLESLSAISSSIWSINTEKSRPRTLKKTIQKWTSRLTCTFWSSMTASSTLKMIRRCTWQLKSYRRRIVRSCHMESTLVPERIGGKSHKWTNVDWVQEFFEDYYHNLNLAQKLSAGQIGYNSANAVVPIRGIDSTLDNLGLAATADQIHVGQMMAPICQLIETNKILRDHINQLSNIKAVLERQVQEEKKLANKNESYLTKLDPKRYFWICVWRFVKGHNSRSYKTNKDGHQDRATITT